MLLAASPTELRKLSSFIGVRANPTIAYAGPSPLWLARSYIAGITLRLAKSPDAPNRITVQGSALPFAPPERFVSIGLVSLRSISRGLAVFVDMASLYLNVKFL
jgi:hypothetical protein